ncbi:DNA polymerase III subunit gamma/tau [Desulfonema magnum]|uniref:DNA polymerase III subunit gamma/tau n=1 Tax=Desulfonema magnum TaxID=45655 RepID=A0A975GML8_9BACT|nr:DNA polymerase III subunit gamma/tau [Desulfonema magnum]QTA85993.1 DNA polymerase III subunit gamma/tau [Desulfonema magnum]
MSYLVLARKYRPQTFDQVVKQEHVTQTLTNAISSGRVAHALLFSGPRGTGKTTIARVLAKAMNCQEGPTATPCNKCQSCKEITSGNAADVFEIDGASNNGVDQIRELRENVKYMPAHSPYKIYIIDEVHMLSIAAFNALLKTLEEPPAHVMFLFATTEPHKIPITILSRCQRHDLRRIDIESVSKHMLSLCQQEGTDIAEESLTLIAREAGGSMRDALSLLDQVMTCAEGTITHEQVLDILGIIDRKILFDISAGILSGNILQVLDIIDEIYNHGHNVKELYSDIIEHFRNLLVVKLGKKINKLVDLPVHETNLMADQVKSVSEAHLSQLLDILFKEESVIQFSAQPKLALEMAFIRMFQAKPVLSIDMLIEKLDNLKKGIYENPAAYSDIESGHDIPDNRNVLQGTSARSVPPPSATESAPVTPDVRKAPPQEAFIRSDAPGNISEPDIPEPEELPVTVSFNPGDSPEETWKKLLGIISEKNGSLGSYLKKCTLKNLTDQALEIEVRNNGFNIDKRIRRDENLAIIKKVCNSFFQRHMEFVINAKEQQKNDRQQKRSQADRLRQEALDHPLVADTLEIFGGRVIDVKILQ